MGRPSRIDYAIYLQRLQVLARTRRRTASQKNAYYHSLRRVREHFGDKILSEILPMFDVNCRICGVAFQSQQPTGAYCGSESCEEARRQKRVTRERGARRVRVETRKEYQPIPRPRSEPPQVRSDCLPGGKNEQRPCQWVSCRYHLATAVGDFREAPSKTVPKLDLLPDTCALDVAARGPLRLEALAETLRISRERARQLEADAVERFRKRVRMLAAQEGVEPADILPTPKYVETILDHAPASDDP